MGKTLLPLFALLYVASAQFYPGAGYAGAWVLQSWGEVWPKPISIEQRNDEVAQIDRGSFSFDVMLLMLFEC